MYITCTRTTVNVVTRYCNIYLGIDLKDHDTEYTYSISIDEGGTSIDVSTLPRHTPNICYYYPSIDAPLNGNGRENGYVFGV